MRRTLWRAPRKELSLELSHHQKRQEYALRRMRSSTKENNYGSRTR